MIRFKPILTLAALAGLAASVMPQSFNCDLDDGFGDAQSGNGAPPPDFPGAAQQSGLWNRLDAAGPRTPTSLYGLDGTITTAQILATGGTGLYGGSGFQGNTGSYALLLNDYAVVAGEIDYHFSGFEPGRYLIYTYAVNAIGLQVNAQVIVPGALNPTQIVTGPMPGNQFILGVTHSIHDITITGDSFEIDVSGPWPNTDCNGFQIVSEPVPEPLTLFAFGIGFVPLLLKRRRSG